MARYSGPKLKKVRQLGTQLPGLTSKTEGEKKNPPGQHGAKANRRSTDYGVRLREKQKLRFNYGVSEKQMKRYYGMAKRSKENTGKKLLAILESRLDNVVFRSGFAPTIAAARQLVNHGHIEVNGQRTNIPSFLVSAQDSLKVREKGQQIPFVIESAKEPALTHPSYLAVNESDFSAQLNNLPQADDAPLDIDESLIVEYYARLT